MFYGNKYRNAYKPCRNRTKQNPPISCGSFFVKGGCWTQEELLALKADFVIVRGMDTVKATAVTHMATRRMRLNLLNKLWELNRKKECSRKKTYKKLNSSFLVNLVACWTQIRFYVLKLEPKFMKQNDENNCLFLSLLILLPSAA